MLQWFRKGEITRGKETVKGEVKKFSPQEKKNL